MKRIVVLALACLAAACSGELTELVVVVDSDLAVPSELDSVRVTTESMSAAGAITNAEPLPRTVGIVHRGGESLGPIVITVIGTQAATEVVRAEVTTSFIRGRTLVLPVFLSRRCIAEPSACVREVDPATLARWNGTVPRADGGPATDGGPPCTPSEERCNGADDDCDSNVDESFDLTSDPQNCGACMAACMLPSATESCSGGACTIASCEAGFGDCNDDASDGCEQDILGSPEHCGGCGDACALANATATCTDGVCALDACDSGFADCNGDGRDGCEASLTSITHCGACGVPCTVTGGTATCASGTCAIASCDDPSLGDCNADASDGCETALDTLTDCGACGMACGDLPNASEVCASGACAIGTCDAGWDDCDGDPTNGCETPLSTLTDCGACGVTCSLAHASETCASGTCEVESCSGDWGDCDGDPANGCETDTDDDDDHCGMCGNACTGGDECRNGDCR